MKTISKCPVCGSSDLEQKFYHKPFDMHTPIGGEHRSSPPTLNGTTCRGCGTKNTFNKKGKCPACEGTGQFVERTYRGGIEQTALGQLSYQCPMCEGKGKI